MSPLHVLHITAATILMVSILSIHSSGMNDEGYLYSQLRSKLGFPPPERPPASSFINRLQPNRILKRKFTYEIFPGRYPEPEVPFYKTLPLYDFDEVPTTRVEQALRDYGSVGILGRDAEDSTMISFDNGSGKLYQQSLENPEEAMRILKADHRLHKPYKALKGLNVIPSERMNVKVDGLPHFDSKPILREPFASDVHILSAFKKEPGQFYLLQRDGKYVLVWDHHGLKTREAADEEKAGIEEALDQYDAAAKKYSSDLASIMHGDRIWADPEQQFGRINGIRKKSRKVFNSFANREDMVDELQANGKFRFKDAAGNLFRVMVKNPAARSDEPMKVLVQAIGIFDRGPKI